ncbi:ferritin-like domain-containing protein [Metabacillus iocasae]|uniref:Rubrerythrin n=1 Tax=Priestia iocasae TaxID=2291674 RepID=A0ABS2QT12_9BACI|nr:ferritin-like domain-containing protein [Metabacillus iocasae]MBM7702102.1 rubrerythrin [Metabacillus iocasae]
MYINHSFHLSHYSTLQNDSRLITEIQRAINDEYSAILCYKELAKMAPTQEERQHILEIRKDEKRHFEAFHQIYMSLTGTSPTLTQTEECKSTYRAGTLVAFKDEQETVDFYLDIADKSQNPFIQATFQRAAADEQNHAVWFLFFLTNPHKNHTARRTSF